MQEIVRSTDTYTIIGPWVKIVQLKRSTEIKLDQEYISRDGDIMSEENKRKEK